MLLIVGGTASGKRTYAQSLGFDIADESIAACNIQDVIPRDESAKEIAAQMLPELLTKQVITCSEVGSGVHPIENDEIYWRETVGRLCNELAMHATKVVRMICGIPVVLKDEDSCN